MKIATFIILIAGGTLFLPFPATPLSREKVEARVDDKILTTTELQRSLRPLYQQYRETYSGTELKRYEKNARRLAINSWIEKQLILKQARALAPVVVDPLEVEQEVRKARGNHTPEEFEELLLREGWDEAKYRRSIEELIKVRMLTYREVNSKVAVSPRQVMDYYDRHRAEFVTPASVQVQHIELKAPATEAEKVKTLSQARMILKELDQGKDFETLARQYSQGPYADQGGGMGFREKGELGPKLDEVIFSLPVGRHSRIIETSRAYHIVKVTAKRDAGRVSLKKAWPEIEEKLYQEETEKILDSWINRLKSQTYYYVTPD